MKLNELQSLVKSSSFLGSGSSRSVYKIDDSHIIKVPNSIKVYTEKHSFPSFDIVDQQEDGFLTRLCCPQSYLEMKVYTDFKKKGKVPSCLCPITDFGVTENNIPYIIMPKVETPLASYRSYKNSSYYKRIKELNDFTYTYALEHKNIVSCSNIEMQSFVNFKHKFSSALDCYSDVFGSRNKKTMYQFVQFLRRTGIEGDDLIFNFGNIGVLNDELVFLDYGYACEGLYRTNNSYFSYSC